MIRKLVFSLVILTSVALIIFYWYQQNVEVSTVDMDTVVSAIPSDAVAILDIKDIEQGWHQVKDGNLLYEELVEAGILYALDSTWQMVDSNVFRNKQWQEVFRNNEMHLSMHPVGVKYDYLLSIHLGRTIDKATLRNKLGEILLADIQWSEKKYDEVDIQVITGKGKKYFCAYHHGFFLWSPSSIILENTIRSIHQGNSILNKKDYVSVRNTASKDKNFHAYLDYAQLPSISALYLSGIDRKILNHPLGGWAEFDISLKPNSVMLNGFLLCQDSLNYFLQCFDGQDADRVRISEVMPTNIAWYMHANISDPMAYAKKTIAYWDKLGLASKHQKMQTKFIESVRWNPIKFQSLLGDEIALAVIEPKEDDIKEDYCFFMNVRDDDQAITVLDSLLGAYAAHTDNKTSRARYRSFLYWSIGKSDLMEISFGPLFYRIDHPVFTLIDGHLVISNSVRTNKKIVNQYLADQTLAKDIHYNNFMANTANESNFSIYTNIARAPYYYKDILNDNADDFIDRKMDVFRQFQAVSMQFEKSKNGKYYQTFYCKYNPVYKNESASLWELPLDTSFTNKPYPMVNHNNQQQELLVQDDRLDLYLLSNTGKVIWKNKLDEEIIGRPVQVDRYQNKKLQMLFLTKNYLHLLDRNGKTVEGFPIRLPAEATSELALMDYDQNGRFRLLVGCADGNMYNFDITGKQIEGWAYQAGDVSVQGVIRHFKIGTKDFILCPLSDGRIKVINRKGEIRYPTSDSLKVFGDFLLVKRKEIGKTALIHADKNGRILRSQLDGVEEVVLDEPHEVALFFSHGDRQGVLTQNGEEIILYDDKAEVLAQFVSEEVLRKVQIHDGGNSLWISGISSDDLVYLYSQGGELQPGFPMTGSSYSSYLNLNNDNLLDLVIGDAEGMLYVYSVENR